MTILIEEYIGINFD